MHIRTEWRTKDSKAFISLRFFISDLYYESLGEHAGIYVYVECTYIWEKKNDTHMVVLAFDRAKYTREYQLLYAHYFQLFILKLKLNLFFVVIACDFVAKIFYYTGRHKGTILPKNLIKK